MTEETSRRLGKTLYEWLQIMVPILLAAIVLFTFSFRMIRVDGESMRETLQDGDLLVAAVGPLRGEYRTGDILIVARRDFHGGEPIVKRLIATEGQTVDIDFAGGTVCVDGETLAEPYIREPTRTPEGLTFPLTVPEGCLFLMGDNRNDSEDSRSAGLGPVDRRCVIGRVVLLAVPGETAELERREWDRVGSLR